MGQLDEYFTGSRMTFDIPLHLCGTEFQKRVWLSLPYIPYGETRSYKDIAVGIGQPNAVRAGGTGHRSQCHLHPRSLP